MQLRATSESMAQLQPGSVSMLMSVAPVVIKGHAESWVLDHHLEPCWCLRVMLQPGPCRPEWLVLLHNAMVTSEPELQIRAMSVLMALLQLGFMLVLEASATIEGHADT